MDKYALVIVDLQHDFYDPNGSFYVNGAETLPEKVVEFINTHKDEISEVILTADWHPANHCSFIENGGTWPSHCIANTVGAGVPKIIMEAIRNNNLHYQFLFKGRHPNIEQYGAGDVIYSRVDYWSGIEYVIANAHNQLYQNVVTPETKFAFCGLCGDYCVMETMKNFLNYDHFEVMAIPSLIMSIDGGEKFENFINENNIQTI